MAFDIEMIKEVYAKYPERIAAARSVVGKPLTLAEKILYAHLWEGNARASYERGNSYVDFAPDRIACQDATAQMALLQTRGFRDMLAATICCLLLASKLGDGDENE